MIKIISVVMKSDLEKLDIKWECSKLGTPKKLTSWDELYRMTELASEDKSKDMNPRLLNGKKIDDWTHHTFSCIDIDRPNDGYVEKILGSDILERFSNIIFIQKSYSGKLHIVYQIPDTDDFEIARLYICTYIQKFIEWCDDVLGITFTAADKRKLRSSYKSARNCENDYDEGDIDLKFASNRVQPVYINSNEIIANENYVEWNEKDFLSLDWLTINYVNEYFKYIVTYKGIELCNEGKIDYPLYSNDADEVFKHCKCKLSESLYNVKQYKEVIKIVNDVVINYYVNVLNNNNLNSNFPLSIGVDNLSVKKEEIEGRNNGSVGKIDIYSTDLEEVKNNVKNDANEGYINGSTGKIDIYSTDLEEVKNNVPYCYNSVILDYKYDNYEKMIDLCINRLKDSNLSYYDLTSYQTLYKPAIDLDVDGKRFDCLPKFYFFDEKIKGSEVKQYIRQTIKGACMVGAVSINYLKLPAEDNSIIRMICSTVLKWIWNNVSDSIDRNKLIEYFCEVKRDWSKISVGIDANKYKCIHGKLDTNEERIKYAREVVLPKKYADVEETVIKVIDEAYPDSNDFEIKDLVELLNNYNGVGVQKKTSGKWTYKSVSRLIDKFGGLKIFKMRRLSKLK